MKTKRIVAAVLATAMTVGTGTIAASAREWTHDYNSAVRSYDSRSFSWDYFELGTNRATTLTYHYGNVSPGITGLSWDIDVEAGSKKVEIGFSKNNLGSWAPQFDTIHTSAMAVGKKGTVSNSNSNDGWWFIKVPQTEISSSAELGWNDTFEHGTVDAKYDTIGFEVLGSIRNFK